MIVADIIVVVGVVRAFSADTEVRGMELGVEVVAEGGAGAVLEVFSEVLIFA